jgi:oligoribonuclease NrnB/cAMP/cGMP phosphodiesterase (DHH superfamily)
MNCKFDLCIYHHNCLDGLVAAWIVKKNNPDITLIPCSPGNDPKIIDGTSKKIIFVDICPSIEFLQNLAIFTENITILDHHRTNYLKFTNYKGDINPIFDLNKCGAMITWEYFNPGIEAPEFIKYVDDHDRWIKQLPYSNNLISVMMTDYFTIEGIDQLASIDLKDLYERGTLLERVDTENIQRAIKNRLEVKFIKHDQEYNVYVYSDFEYLRTYIGDKLLDIPMRSGLLPDFVAFYVYSPIKNSFYITLRGRDDRVDCSEICRSFPNGGGHRNACGFEISPSEFKTLFQLK